MRRLILSVAVLCVAVAGAASTANAAVPVMCENAATIKLSPGLSATAQVQNITVKGTLTNCAGTEATVTGGSYVAHLKTDEAVTCAALSSVGALDTGTVVIKWSPKGQGNSHSSFTMPLTELTTEIGGLVEAGPFASASISGSVTQSYTDGATCGIAEGKKKAKKVSKGSLTGTLTV